MEAAKPTIIYFLVIMDLLSAKRRRSFTTQKVMRGLGGRQVLENPEGASFWKKI
jgi:hypothetical protein